MWQRRTGGRRRIRPDGLYGDETARVARDFQNEKGLAADALVGRDTWNAAWESPGDVMTEFPIKYTKDGGVVVGQGFADEAPQGSSYADGVPAEGSAPHDRGMHLVGLALTALAGASSSTVPGVEGVLDQLELL